MSSALFTKSLFFSWLAKLQGQNSSVSWKKNVFLVFFVARYIHILAVMNNPNPPESLLQQIAGINRMERGKLSVIREGSTGPFYNLQYREAGKNKTVYVPREQADQVRENTDNYRKAAEIFDQYVEQKSEQARSERQGGKKRPVARVRSRAGRRNPLLDG